MTELASSPCSTGALSHYPWLGNAPGFSWRSWRLCERLFFGLGMTENEVAKQIVDAAYRIHTSAWSGSAGISLRSGPGVRTGKSRSARGPATSLPIVYQG